MLQETLIYIFQIVLGIICAYQIFIIILSSKRGSHTYRKGDIDIFNYLKQTEGIKNRGMITIILCTVFILLY